MTLQEKKIEKLEELVKFLDDCNFSTTVNKDEWKKRKQLYNELSALDKEIKQICKVCWNCEKPILFTEHGLPRYKCECGAVHPELNREHSVKPQIEQGEQRKSAKVSWNDVKEKYLEFHKMDSFTENMAIDIDFGYWLVSEYASQSDYFKVSDEEIKKTAPYKGMISGEHKRLLDSDELYDILSDLNRDFMDVDTSLQQIETLFDDYFASQSNGYPDTEADGIVFCGKCGKMK